MTRRPGQEILPLALTVAVLALLDLAARVRSPGVLERRLVLLAPGPVVPALVLLVLVGVLAGRVVATRRGLARRTRLVVLAPDSFDPNLESVLRCAAQLSRVRRLVGGWFDAPASAVRVLLDVDTAGRMRYSLIVPHRALPAVRSALGGYDRVQARPLEAPTEQTPSSKDRPPRRRVRAVRAELRLARPSSEPLAHPALNPDPLQSFARVLAGVEHEHAEQAEIAIDLLPTIPATRRRQRRRLLREARRRTSEPAPTNTNTGLLGERRVGRQPPAEMVQQRAAREELAAKLLAPEPLFHLQILVRCTAPTKAPAVERLQGLLGCFDAFAAANSLRVVGVRVLGVARRCAARPLWSRWNTSFWSGSV
jgi:hypothetical protein